MTLIMFFIAIVSILSSIFCFIYTPHISFGIVAVFIGLIIVVGEILISIIDQRDLIFNENLSCLKELFIR
nr:hypothetical protein F28p_00046 [Serratia proteamaculans]